MPIEVNQLDMQVDVQSPGTAAEPAPTQTPAEALPRWQELAHRQAALTARTAAWDFDD